MINSEVVIFNRSFGLDKKEMAYAVYLLFFMDVACSFE